MAWVTPSSRSTGDIITAAIWNADVVANPQYLKGQAGAVLIEDEVQFDNDAAFVARIASSNPTLVVDTNDFLDYVRASNHWRVVVASTEIARISSTGLFLATSGLKPCLIGPDATARHIEHGNVLSSTIAQYVYEDLAVTFDVAFAAAPTVTLGHRNDTAGEPGNAEAYVKAITTTGCTIRVRNTDASDHKVRAFWVAVGTD